MKRVVLLGTGTGVGKTHVSVALAGALRAAGVRSLQALKPVETGLPPAPAPPPDADAGRLEAASFHVQLPRPHPRFAFPEPTSPHLAARRAGVAIDLAEIRRWVDAAAFPAPEFQLIETAGGAFSPLTDVAVNADLARVLDPAIWVLVAPDALGVLHDVRTTWTALAAFGRPPDCLVLSAARTPDASTGSNAAELPRVGQPAPVAVLERDGAFASLAPLARFLTGR